MRADASCQLLIAAMIAIVAAGPICAEPAWGDLVRGENLARTARVTASLAPYFPADGPRVFAVIQDGVVASEPAQMASSSFAVHWRGAPHVFLRMSLRRPAPIDRIVLRVLGGRSKPHLVYPRAVTAWLSTDGSHWERSGEVLEERDLPVESGEAQIANVVLRGRGALARYIVLHFHLRAEFLYIDEVAVVRGQAPPPGDQAAREATPLHDGRVAFPDKGEIVVSRPSLPTFLTLLEDGRPRPSGSFTAWFDLPRGVGLRGSLAAGTTTDVPSRVRVVAELAPVVAGRGHASRALFFEATGPIPPGASVRITPVGSAGRSLEVPLRTIDIPRVDAPRGLHVSLSWLPRHTAADFPNLVDDLRGLGFNGLGLFPQYWSGGVPSRQETAWIAAARAKGMALVYVESPFHVMEQRRSSAREIRTQLGGGRVGTGVSPCYRGRYYAEELARIEAAAHRLQPRWVFFDSELWTQGARDAGLDHWCDRLRNTGDERTALLARASGELARDLERALSSGVPGKEVLSGFYAVDPTHRYQGFFDFEAMAKAGVDFAMPSLYVSGDPLAVRERIRAIAAARPGTRIIPWLTAGTQGEYPPLLLRASVLEAFFSGAIGITYYKIDDFDSPSDFAAHVQAIAIVSRHEAHFTQGEIDDRWSAQAGSVSVTVRRLGRRALVLVGNYRSRAVEDAELGLPCEGRWRDVETNTELDARSLRASLAPGETRVFACGEARS